ncbi:MAG: Nif3-like dinuclear metal center hexameric protein, partial [Acidimicrobiia bacterium]|nr:Nif3-like dinuclear metal center hexameric protein [Acidimicrobiia bacterium]
MLGVKVGELVRAIDAVVPLSGAGTWDAVGLQVGDPQREAGAVGVCHEVSADVVEVCHQAGIGTLVTYHPLLFRPTRTFLAGPDAGGKAMALAKQDVSVISIHTAFDVARPGTADAYGAAIGGTLVGTFAPVDDEGGAGIGRVFALSA